MPRTHTAMANQSHPNQGDRAFVKHFSNLVRSPFHAHVGWWSGKKLRTPAKGIKSSDTLGADMLKISPC